MSVIEREVQVTRKQEITVCDGPDCDRQDETRQAPTGWYCMWQENGPNGGEDEMHHFHALSCLAAWVEHRAMHYDGQAKAPRGGRV